MSPRSHRQSRLLITLVVAILLTAGSVLAIQIAKGYRPNLKQLELHGMGLLSATSYPKSAQVFVNDRLTTVTDDTLYLNPGIYQIKMFKNGFSPWVKTIPIKAEIVSLTDSRLFPSIPSSTPITFNLVDKALPSPDGNKILYFLNGASFENENGLFVLSLNNQLLGNQTSQVADITAIDYAKTDFMWSPDSSQILAITHDDKKILSAKILNPKIINTNKNLTDQTIRLANILNQYQDQLIKINQNHLSQFPDFMVQVASTSAFNVYFSPDGEKMFYTPTTNLKLPENEIAKTLTTINPSAETRDLQKNKTYLFDRREGTNYLLSVATYDEKSALPLLLAKYTISNVKSQIDPLLSQFSLLKGQLSPLSTQNLSWFPDSNHLIVKSDSGANIMEYDGQNNVAITSGTLKDKFAVASPDGNRLIILSNLNQKPTTFNLISLDLK